MEFNNKTKPKKLDEKKRKKKFYVIVNDLFEGRELTLNTFKSGIFPLKSSQEKD